MNKVAELIKAYRDEVDHWRMVPTHVVLSRERLTAFVEYDLPFLVERESILLKKKLVAMRQERLRQAQSGALRGASGTRR